MTAKLTPNYLQSSEIVKIPRLSRLLAKSLSALDIQALTLVCLVIFAIHISSVPGFSAPVMEGQNGEANSELKIASIRITGSMCPACLKRLEDKLRQINGVTAATITPLPAKKFRPSLKAEIHPHYRKALVAVDYQPAQTNPNQIVEAIKQNDFGVLSVSSHKHEQTSQSDDLGK